MTYHWDTQQKACGQGSTLDKRTEAREWQRRATINSFIRHGAKFTDSQNRTHKGVLKVDANCADAEVRYPVNTDIIHDGCKIADRCIKKICEGLHIKKIRSCYSDARSFYLELVKRRKKGAKLIRSTISAMLSYLNKDLRKLAELFAEYRGSKDFCNPMSNASSEQPSTCIPSSWRCLMRRNINAKTA